MKLSFSLPSKQFGKPTQKPSENFNDGDRRDDTGITKLEYVTEFDASKSLTGKSEKLVIPPKQNEWRPTKKMKNLDLPFQSSTAADPDIRFELEAPSTVGIPDSGMSYGLNLRLNKEGDADAVGNGVGDEADNDAVGAPSRPLSSENLLLQKFKEDMKRLPDDRGFDEFTTIPVEGFGAALLAGYGWVEGRGIGRNAKEDVKIVQYERRTAKEGLGFKPEMHDKKQEGRNSGLDHAATTRPDRHEKVASKEDRDGVSVGMVVRVVGGRHMGLKGKVVEKLGSASSDLSKIVLKLLDGREEVTVKINEVAELGSAEEKKCLKKLAELKIQESGDDRSSRDERRATSGSHGYDREKRDGSKDYRRKDKRQREEGRRGDEMKTDNGTTSRSSSRREEETGARVSWLVSHIRVRIISKDFKGGKLYLKKGKVVDVVGPTTCDISMDESRELIQCVDQEILETALPKRGGPVLVLYGKHKGVFGNLVERDMESETGVIRDADTHALLNVRLEQIAEYIGDPSLLGY